MRTSASHRFASLILTMLLLAACSLLPGPSPLAAPRPTADGAAQVEEYLGKLAGQGLFSGVLLVARDGEVLLERGYGWADRARGEPITPGTRFYTADLTMPFTAAAILLLEQDGLLSVHDPVCRYLPACPEPWQTITIHHLLIGAAGFRPWEQAAPRPLVAGEGPVDQAELLEALVALPLVAEAGDVATARSDPSYVLAGLIVERVAGILYGQFLHERIFAPLRMRETGYGEAGRRLAKGYADAAGSPDGPYEPTAYFSAGGVYTTARDLLRWDQALYGDAPLTAASRDRMFRAGQWPPQWCHSDRLFGATGYGYGWETAEIKGREAVVAAGWGNGYAAALWRFPEERITIIMLSNRRDSIATLSYYGGVILELVLGRLQLPHPEVVAA